MSVSSAMLEVVQAVALAGKRDRIAGLLFAAVLVDEEEDPWTALAVRAERVATALDEAREGFGADLRTPRGKSADRAYRDAAALAEQLARDARQVAEAQAKGPPERPGARRRDKGPWRTCTRCGREGTRRFRRVGPHWDYHYECENADACARRRVTG